MIVIWTAYILSLERRARSLFLTAIRSFHSDMPARKSSTVCFNAFSSSASLTYQYFESVKFPKGTYVPSNINFMKFVNISISGEGIPVEL